MNTARLPLCCLRPCLERLPWSLGELRVPICLTLDAQTQTRARLGHCRTQSVSDVLWASCFISLSRAFFVLLVLI